MIELSWRSLCLVCVVESDGIVVYNLINYTMENNQEKLQIKANKGFYKLWAFVPGKRKGWKGFKEYRSKCN